MNFDAFMPNLFVQPRKITAKNSNSKWSKFQVAEHGGTSLDSHEVELKQHVVPAPNIQDVLRIASVVMPASAVLRPIQ